MVTGTYYPAEIHEYRWAIDLPEGYSYDDVDDIIIKWTNEVFITFKDGTEITLDHEGEHYSTDGDFADCDAFKWAEHIDWADNN